jgi:hypothetical protein
MSARFPLILTFSLREKEQPLSALRDLKAHPAEERHGFARTLGAFLPLPKGEGRGEGEHN